MARRRNPYIFVRKRTHPVRRVLLTAAVFFAVGLGMLMAYNYLLLGNVQLSTHRVTVADLPSDLESFSILHLSDLHGVTMGEGMSRLQRAIGEQSYSCVVMTGDMVGVKGDVQPLLDVLAVMPRGAPVFILPGDEDPAYLQDTAQGTSSPYTAWAEAVTRLGAVLLDEPYLITRGRNDRSRLWLIPEDLYSLDLSQLESVYSAQLKELNGYLALTPDQEARRRVAAYQVERARRVREKLKDVRDGDVQIVVSHTPLTEDFMTEVIPWSSRQDIVSLRQASLILAGHYCGGQWRLPGKGAVYVPELGWWPDDGEVTGWGFVYGIPQHISAGLGPAAFYPWWESFRFLNPPDVTRVVLTSRMY